MSNPISKLFKDNLRPRRIRKIHDFAETEVILPKGPRKGYPFAIDYMPFTHFIFDAIENPYWRKIALVGPTQCSKTLTGNNIPLLYYLFEQEEDIIMGIPDMDLAKGIWKEKVRPVVENSKFRNLLPTQGAGARGGVPNALQFANGIWLRFMGAGGGDSQRSSHTARIIIMTEVDKMDDIGEASEEADPVSQIEMRADAYEDSKIIMECTVTTEYGRIWQEAMVHGSAGTIYVPCYYCEKYQPLVKEGLVYDDRDARTAQKTAGYQCVQCQKIWTDEQRLRSLKIPLLVHKGQEIKAGRVVGDLPPTMTFGMHWNVLYSPMQSLGKTAAQQFESDKSELVEKKKAMVQSKWALPWKDEDEILEVTFSYLSQRANNSTSKLLQVPEWTDFLLLEIDIQKDRLYWHTESYSYSYTSKVIDYGVVDFNGTSDEHLIKGLNEIKEISKSGWKSVDDDENEVLHIPRLNLIDVGYRTDVIMPWLKGKAGWIPVKGVGKRQRARMSGSKAKFEIPEILSIRKQSSGQYIWFINVDNTKAIVHDRFLIEPGNGGYTHLPNDVTHGYKSHLASERRIYDDRGDKFEWEQVPGKRRNDWLDCRSYGIAASMYLSHKNDLEQEHKNKKTKEKEDSRNSQINPPTNESWYTSRRRTP